MSNSSQSDEGGDEEVLLSMYDQHRQEIRAHGKRKSRRYLGSLTVLGVIIGYVFTGNGDARILALAPYVLGFLYLSHISSMHYVTQLAALLALIEVKLDRPGAEYEFFHGGFSISHNPRFEEVGDFEDVDKFENVDPEADPRQLHQNVRDYVRGSMRWIAAGAYFGIGGYGALALAFTEIPRLGESLPSTESPFAAAILFLSQVAIFLYIHRAWSSYEKYKDILRAGVWNAKQNGVEAEIGKMTASDLTANSIPMEDSLVSDEYSIWLVPDRGTDAYQQLEETIGEYAQRYEDAPEFEPHITVVGGVEGDISALEEGVRSFAEDQDSFSVDFTRVHCSTTRHQCVFLLVEPTVDLLSLHQKAVEVFDVDAGMYVPHLSLVYSDMSMEERLEMVESIDTTALPSDVPIGEITLVKTSGPVSEWETVATYNL